MSIARHRLTSARGLCKRASLPTFPTRPEAKCVIALVKIDTSFTQNAICRDIARQIKARFGAHVLRRGKGTKRALVQGELGINPRKALGWIFVDRAARTCSSWSEYRSKFREVYSSIGGVPCDEELIAKRKKALAITEWFVRGTIRRP